MTDDVCYTDGSQKERAPKSRNLPSKADTIIDELLVHMAMHAAKRNYREMLEALEKGKKENE